MITLISTSLESHWAGEPSHFCQTHMNIQWWAVKGIQNNADLFLWPWGIQTEIAVTPYLPQIPGETHFSLPELQITSGGALLCLCSPREPQVLLIAWGCNSYSGHFWEPILRNRVLCLTNVRKRTKRPRAPEQLIASWFCFRCHCCEAKIFSISPSV